MRASSDTLSLFVMARSKISSGSPSESKEFSATAGDNICTGVNGITAGGSCLRGTSSECRSDTLVGFVMAKPMISSGSPSEVTEFSASFGDNICTGVNGISAKGSCLSDTSSASRTRTSSDTLSLFVMAISKISSGSPSEA